MTTTPTPGTWDKKSLYKHLQWAIEVEFYTIPLYLTAAYSIKPASRKSLTVELERIEPASAPDVEPTVVKETYGVFETVMSVAIQEMYHLMWACNVAKSLGMPIHIQAPDMTKLPTHLKIASGIAAGYEGVGNLAKVIDLLVAIEKPDPKYSYPVDKNDPITNFPGPTAPGETVYDSIGDMYHALSYGINELWDDLHDDAYNDFQKVMIASSYPGVPAVTTLSTALNAIGAICEQGEGTGVEGSIPGEYIPNQQSYEDADKFTHYERFIAIQKSIDTIKDHLYAPTTGATDDKDQKELTQNYSMLIYNLNNSYQIKGSVLNTPGMDQMAVNIMNMMAKGVFPTWSFDPNIDYTPALELHICQGLNSCAGHGINGSGTMAGDGDCATVNHVCQGANDCRGQGACGYPGQTKVGGPNNVLLPGSNACKGLGGCQSPISVWQVFKDPNSDLNGKYVWCEARKLFEARMTANNMPIGTPTTAPAQIRLKKGTNVATAPLADNTSCPPASTV